MGVKYMERFENNPTVLGGNKQNSRGVAMGGIESRGIQEVI
jgi:hypothetical protein